MAAITYLITHTQRTGSNWLCDVLAHTGMAGINDVNRCGLFIGYGEGLRAAGVYPERVDEYFRDSTSPNGVCGMKSDWDYLDHLRQHLPEGAVNAILGRYTHFIFLQRRDIEAQAISWYIAAKSGVFTSANQGKPGKGDPLAVPYDREKIVSRIRRIHAANTRWLDYFLDGRDEPVYPLLIQYEDMAADMPGTVRRIFDFLGIEAADIPIRHLLQKQHNPLKAQFLERYRSEKVPL